MVGDKEVVKPRSVPPPLLKVYSLAFGCLILHMSQSSLSSMRVLTRPLYLIAWFELDPWEFLS